MSASRSNKEYGAPVQQGDEPAPNDAPNTLVADEDEGPHQEQPFDDDDVADEMKQISGTNAMLSYEDSTRNRRCRKAALIGLVGLTFAGTALAVALVGGKSHKTSSGQGLDANQYVNADGRDYSYGPPQDWGKSSCGRATAELSPLTHSQPVEGSPISRIAFASCFRPYLQVSDALWRHMRESFQPDLFIWLGDNMCTYETSFRPLSFAVRGCLLNNSKTILTHLLSYLFSHYPILQIWTHILP